MFNYYACDITFTTNYFITCKLNYSTNKKCYLKRFIILLYPIKWYNKQRILYTEKVMKTRLTAYGHVTRVSFMKIADNQLELIVINTKISWLSLPIYTYPTGGVTWVVCTSESVPSENIIPLVTYCNKCCFAYGRDNQFKNEFVVVITNRSTTDCHRNRS